MCRREGKRGRRSALIQRMSRSSVSFLTFILIFSSYLSAFVFSLRYLKAERWSPIVVQILGKAKSFAFTRLWVWSEQLYITGCIWTPCNFHSSKSLPAFRCVLLRWQLHLFFLTFFKKTTLSTTFSSTGWRKCFLSHNNTWILYRSIFQLLRTGKQCFFGVNFFFHDISITQLFSFFEKKNTNLSNLSVSNARHTYIIFNFRPHFRHQHTLITPPTFFHQFLKYHLQSYRKRVNWDDLFRRFCFLFPKNIFQRNRLFISISKRTIFPVIKKRVRFLMTKNIRIFSVRRHWVWWCWPPFIRSSPSVPSYSVALVVWYS